MKRNILKKVILLIATVVIVVLALSVCKYVSQFTRFWENELNISQNTIEEIVNVLNQFDYVMPEGYDESEGEPTYPTKKGVGIYHIATDTYELSISKFSGKEMTKEDFYSCSPCYFENHSDSLNGRYYKMIETGEFGDYCWISTPLEAYINEDDIIPLYGLYYGDFCIQNGEDAYICQYSVCTPPSIFFGLKPPALSALEMLEDQSRYD